MFRPDEIPTKCDLHRRAKGFWPWPWKYNDFSEGFLKLGCHFGGPHNKEYSILGSTLGSPLYWETTIL